MVNVNLNKNLNQLVVLIFFSAFPLLAATPAATLEILANLSLPYLTLVMATFEGSIGT